MRIDPNVYAGLSPEDKAYVDRELAAYEALVERNPLQAFEPHSPAQREFLEARTAIIAAFAGNRFGKTTSLIVKSLAQLVPADFLPSHLRHYKRFDAPCSGWLVVPTTDKLYDTMIPALQKWTPKDALVQGRWDKSWSKERRQLNFACGSTLACKTYEQDASTLGGAALHFVGYDEPPPKLHREECMTRLVDHGGFEMFAMTPLKTNTGWIRRDIWRNRESPDITVIKGSMHDNPLLDEASKQRLLGSLSDLWRRAREFGDFVDVGGLIYPDFERCVASEDVAKEWLERPVLRRDDAGRPVYGQSLVQMWDVVVGIDPGIRNAGFVFVGFDRDETAHVFDALLLQDSTAKEYAVAIRAKLARWGLSTSRVSFVADPASRQRGQTNAETVMSALAQEGIFCNPGQNDVQAGIDQMRARMAHDRLRISPERNPGLLGLRAEAEDYAAKEPDEGRDDSHMEVVKSNDHRLDALRYAVMERFWDPVVEAEAPKQMLGFDPTRAVDISGFRATPEGHPLGFMT